MFERLVPEQYVTLHVDNPIAEIWSELLRYSDISFLSKEWQDRSNHEYEYVVTLLTQAYEYYQASRVVTLKTKPLQMYYCFLNLTKAVLFIKTGKQPPDYHGLSNVQTGEKILDFSAKVNGGVFLALANSLNANIKKDQRITLGDFGSNAVDISWQQHRFLPEIPPQFAAPYLYLEIGNLSIEFNMENCAIVPNLRSKVKDNTNLFDEFNISFESENCFTLRSKQLNLKQSQEDAINLVKNYFCYSIYPNNASYLNIQPKEKQIPQILAYYGIIFILGDIVRYKPNVIYSLLEAKETSIRWFINKLCEISERAYPNLMLNYLLGETLKFSVY